MSNIPSQMRVHQLDSDENLKLFAVMSYHGRKMKFPALNILLSMKWKQCMIVRHQIVQQGLRQTKIGLQDSAFQYKLARERGAICNISRE